MTKSTKIILITAGVLVGLGMIIAGIALGINKIRNNVFGFSDSASATYEDKSMEIKDDFEDIEIVQVSSDVNVVSTSKSTAYIEYTDSNRYHNEITVKGDTLRIEFKDDSASYVHIGFDIPFLGLDRSCETFPVTLYLPEKDYGNLNIAIVSGETSIDPMSFENIEIDGVSGEIKVRGCDLDDNFKANTVSGSVNCEGLNAGDVSVNTTSGEVSLTKTNAEDVDIDCISGSVSLNSLSASSVDIQTTSGEVTLDDYQSKSTDISTVSGDVSGTLIGDYNISYDTVSGDSNISISSTAGGNHFDVETTSGNLTLK